MNVSISEHRASKKMGVATLLSMLVLIILPIWFSHIPAINWILPWGAAMGTFYWALYQPRHYLVAESFLLGLLQDVIIGTPLGFYAAGLIMLHALASYQRSWVRSWSFPVIWLAFSMNLLLVMAVQAAIMAIAGATPALWTLVVWGSTCAIFPLVFIVLTRLNQAVLKA